MTARLLADAPLESIKGIGNFQPAETGGTGTGPEQLQYILTMVFGFLTIVGGLAFLIYFIVGAISWITAGGDQKKVDSAKTYMTNGAIGMIIIVAAYSIVWIVGEVLGFKILDPVSTIKLITPGSTTN